MLRTALPLSAIRWRTVVTAAVALGSTVSGCHCVDKVAAIRPAIGTSLDTIEFGAVGVGASAEQQVEVTNKGKGTLNITAIKVTAGDTEIAVTRKLTLDCQGAERKDADLMALTAGSCARFTVRYVPTGVHATVGNIEIDSNDAEGRTPLNIPVTGNGIVGQVKVCILSADDTVKEENCARPLDTPAFYPTLDFGPAPMGDTLKAKVRVQNIGSAALVVTNAHVDGTGPDITMTGLTYNGTLKPNESTDLEIVFKPDGDGARTATLIITSSDLQAPEVQIPIKATANGPALCIDPDTGLDFGTVTVGQTRDLTLTLKNCGLASYQIKTLSLTNGNPATEAFVIGNTGLPQLPLQFEPGQQIVIPVTYRPQHVDATGDPGDTGFFTIETTYQRGTRPVMGRGGSPGCGGGQPIGVIKVANAGVPFDPATGSIKPLDTATLDGSASTIPPNVSVSYHWRLVSQPPNGTSSLKTTPNPIKPTLYMELAGDYVVELVVSTEYGCQSPPVQVTIHCVPKSKVHVQLSWPQSFGDVDLHYIGPGGKFYQSASGNPAGDLYWPMAPSHGGNAPDWGLNNTVSPDHNSANDPTLDIDALWGNGPENANHDQPFDGAYQVSVHYYCSRQSTLFGTSSSYGPTSPTVKVFLNGVVAFTATKTNMTQRDVWDVATVTVSGGGTQFAVAPINKPLTKVTQGCSSAGN